MEEFSHVKVDHIDVEEGVTDDDRVVGQEARAKQLSKILAGEVFLRKF